MAVTKNVTATSANPRRDAKFCVSTDDVIDQVTGWHLMGDWKLKGEAKVTVTKNVTVTLAYN